jgi:hypothetical protein
MVLDASKFKTLSVGSNKVHLSNLYRHGNHWFYLMFARTKLNRDRCLYISYNGRGNF